MQVAQICSYQNWDWVLEQLDLQPLDLNPSKELENTKRFRRGGESEEHKKFKAFISKNSASVGLSSLLQDGEQEYKLPSSD